MNPATQESSPPQQSSGPANQMQANWDDMQPAHDLVDYVKQYAREKPEVAALWCFGVGFVLGWKLKIW